MFCINQFRAIGCYDNNRKRSVMNKNLKTIIDSALVLCFVVVLTTGVMLHLKKHGIIIEPRPLLKMLHYCTGFVMVALTAVHVGNYIKSFKALSVKYPYTVINSQVLMVMLAIVFLTGLVKLLSPVKILNFGLWHYWLGIIMSVAAVIHLWRMLPWLMRKYRR